jgi:xanthine dehydrogenase accessory factor
MRWRAAPVFWQRGGMTHPDRDVVDALIATRDPDACLAVVLETEGSTYVGAGSLALFGAAPRQVGWLSGGCLEASIALRAEQAVQAQRIGWLQIDTRDDEDLLSGSALGCRGRLCLALLPLQALPGWPALFAAWWHGCESLTLSLDPSGTVALQLGTRQSLAMLAAERPEWTPPSADRWRIEFPRPPRIAIFGVGPETPSLLPLLRGLGWYCIVIESRERWREALALADAPVILTPDAACADPRLDHIDAALVMHHHFERDREALAALAPRAIGFIGLLGPVRRREDLWRVLAPQARAALEPRLHSPVGLRLGGRGAHAIALSIAAELQAWRHRD